MKRNISCNIITNDDGSSPLYGLELCCIYSQEDDAQYHTVTRCVNGITDSFEEACKLRRILLENEVEPMASCRYSKRSAVSLSCLKCV